MDPVALQFLPYPHVFRGERRDGIHIPWPDRCGSCNRQCESAASSGVGLCSYGLNYARIDDDLLVAGVVARDYPTHLAAHRRMVKKLGKKTIVLTDLRAVIDAASAADARFASEVDDAKRAIIEEYKASAGYLDDIVRALRPDVQRSLAQVHDYRQLITQIVQNVNVIVETAEPGTEFEVALSSAAPELRAIYWAARLLESKLEAALYLMYPEKIDDPKSKKNFRLHGLVTKYSRIYGSTFQSKDLKVVTAGGSWGSLHANPDAVGVIPHAFLDNAAKYAPPGTTITLWFAEDEEHITFEVESFGPPIRPHEFTQVFDLFFRGEAAQAQSVEGTGFGLALASHIACVIGAQLSVNQGGRKGPDGTVITSFTAVFPKGPLSA
ncbi:sensor histidine kinase [Kibdelosporangium aridum]|uniref:Sensor-like histidine kinase SenX3 n=1 Tax=Kibdelosporangium aridum TaxID=2030 RepID=A0A1Y5XXZ9_KIBAR|nr:sensor histidine kinase [Kibdelosporangium aridum]SMD18688.1 Signal transduction histidine kinase [Kibdelosporangium aridum]